MSLKSYIFPVSVHVSVATTKESCNHKISLIDLGNHSVHSELLKRTMHSLGILAFYESDDPKVFFSVS